VTPETRSRFRLSVRRRHGAGRRKNWWPGRFLQRIGFCLYSSPLVALLHSAAAAPRYSRSGEVRKGTEVFQLCLGCHSAESEEKKVGPSLKGLFKRNQLRDDQPVTEKIIRLLIEKGRDGMPSFSETLSPKQMDQLIAYRKEL
jgi:cytochrome c